MININSEFSRVKYLATNSYVSPQISLKADFLNESEGRKMYELHNTICMLSDEESMKEKFNLDGGSFEKSLVYGTRLSTPSNMYYLLTKLHCVSSKLRRRQPTSQSHLQSGEGGPPGENAPLGRRRSLWYSSDALDTTSLFPRELPSQALPRSRVFGSSLSSSQS